jgi:sugar phosphate isomerase/epimerase
VEIALEIYEGGPIGSGRLAVNMVERIGAANVGINLDVGNLYRSPLSEGETWLDCVRTCLPVTDFWRAKDYRRTYEHPSGRHVGSIATNLSDGDIDYRQCLALAREHDYRGPAIVEHYGGDGLAAQAAGAAYLREVLESQS